MFKVKSEKLKVKADNGQLKTDNARLIQISILSNRVWIQTTFYNGEFDPGSG